MSRLAAALERELPLLHVQRPRSESGLVPTPPCFKEFIELTECMSSKGSKCCTVEYSNFLQCLREHGFLRPKT